MSLFVKAILLSTAFLFTSLTLIAQESAEKIAADDYNKLSAVEVVNLFSGQLLEKISIWDKLRKQDNEKFISELDQWGRPWFNQRRLAAGIMGKEYYRAASKQQRSDFTNELFSSLIRNYAQGLFLVEVTNIEIISNTANKNPKYHTVVQRVASGDRDAKIEYLMYRKDEQDYWKVVNLVANGINFKKTLHGSFKRLAQRHGGDIDAVIANWDNTEVTNK